MKKGSKSTGKRSSLSQGVLTSSSKSPAVGRNNRATTPLQNLIIEENLEREDFDDVNVIPRKNSPSKVESVALPNALSELSLTERDGQQKLEESNSPELIDGVLEVEVSQEDSTIEQNTESFNSQSLAEISCHAPDQEDQAVCSQSDAAVNGSNSITEGSTTSSNVNQENIEATYTKPPSPAAVKGKGSAKKKRYIPVQSRYMQQGYNNSNNSNNSNSTLELSAIPSNSDGKNKENKRMKKKAGISHSTPYLQDQTVFNYNDGSFMDTTAVKKKEATAAAAAAKKDRRKTCMSTNDLRKPKEKEQQTPVSQLQMDLHHCRNLHMAFLHAQARQTFEAEEQKAKEEMYAIYQANTRLKHEIYEMEQKIQAKEAEMAVDLLLRAQADGLEDIHKKLPDLTVAMSQITSAVRNTARYMKMENVILEEEKHLEALEESKRLLSQVTELTSRNQPGIEGLSSAAHDLKAAVLDQLGEQRLCMDLLATYKSLNNQERSLAAQVIQSSNME